MFCALKKAICGRNYLKVGFCVQWISFSNDISLLNIVVVRGKKEGNDFLRIYRGPVLKLLRNTEANIQFFSEDVNAKGFVP